MKLLLDAHSLYWAIYDPDKLPPAVRAAIADFGNSLFVSLATLWEMANKAAVDRLPLAGPSVHRMVERIEQLGVEFLPITQAEIIAAATLPHHHADPFDRILVAQAQGRGLHLVTKDGKLKLYDVQILWR